MQEVYTYSQSVYEARRVSNITLEDAASICGLTSPSFAAREKNPEKFRVEELQKLFKKLNPTGKELLTRGVEAIFLTT